MNAKVNVLPEFRNDSRGNLASAYESGNKTIFSNLEIENLLPIKEESGKVVISARDLHRFLCIGKDFSTWIKDRIEKYGLVENEDYVVIVTPTVSPKGGRPLKEYLLSPNIAGEFIQETRFRRHKRIEYKTYIISGGNKGLYKIGKSCDVDKRIKVLKLSNTNIKLVAYIDKDIEKEIHTKYKENCYGREWFLLSDKLLRTIIKKYGFKKSKQLIDS